MAIASPGALPSAGIEPLSPTWQADSLQTKPPAKPQGSCLLSSHHCHEVQKRGLRQCTVRMIVAGRKWVTVRAVTQLPVHKNPRRLNEQAEDWVYCLPDHSPFRS